MTRLMLALLLGLSMLVSFSAHAGGRDGHYGKHHRNCHKHQRHYANHRRHSYSHGQRCHECRESRRHRHVVYAQPYAQPYVAPRIELGAYYGPSGVEAVIVYQDRLGH